MNFQEATYTVIDVETTGGVSNGRMTEICIMKVTNGKVVDVYQTLINPEAWIPQHITALTGIDNELVAAAPKFHEIAKIVEEKTKDAIFVAHNVNFDFGFLKKEFDLLGFKFLRKKLCTVRLSRKLIPGLRSYILGKLCRDVGISLKGAHRAEADTRATTELFLNLWKLDASNDFSTFQHFMHKSSRQATLPPNLSTEDFEKLPETTGVYLFKDQLGKIIYVGKAKNIKSRVLSHIYGKSQKAVQLCEATFHLDYEETGNELCALLLEAEYIRKHYPKYNRAQKRPLHTYQIISYTNQRGVLHLAMGKTKNTQNSVLTLYNKIAGIEVLIALCEKYTLCPKYCSLQITNEPCSHYKIKDCLGVCSGDEEVAIYNERVHLAIEDLHQQKETFVIKQKGRTSQESCLILVENGEYLGFGFIDQDIVVNRFEDFKDYITRYKNNYHTTKLVSSFLKKHRSGPYILYPEGAVSI